MFANTQKCLLVLLISLSYCALAFDFTHTDITIVNDETRYSALYPDADLVAFDKIHHAKGNYVFTAGERITGDRFLFNSLDKTQFTKAEDIEVILRYASSSFTISCIDIYTDQTSDKANVYFTAGGINNSFAEILLTCNQTQQYTYELFIYVY